ncbi:BlaI/MecI/CopY family transcriptional regulator [Verrucomicrobiales bacterium]|jgi:BlaI family penicillinase repressor|nr:BlaI/MecI/CopY family transcriptional regulator [Verrucomicrobiales bacterium]
MTSSKRNVPQISDAEWSVMRVFWDGGNCSTGDVISVLEKSTNWSSKTIQTLIRRLHKKGAIDVVSKNGREFVYGSTVAERECEHAATSNFLGRVFDGQLAPFLASFVENENLSADQIAELRKILDENETKPETQKS